MHEKIWFRGLPERGRARRFPAEYRRRSPRWYLVPLVSCNQSWGTASQLLALGKSSPARRPRPSAALRPASRINRHATSRWDASSIRISFARGSCHAGCCRCATACVPLRSSIRVRFPCSPSGRFVGANLVFALTFTVGGRRANTRFAPTKTHPTIKVSSCPFSRRRDKRKRKQEREPSGVQAVAQRQQDS